MEIGWKEGELQGPHGACRQLPRDKTAEWNSRLFITKDGAPTWRHYNVATRQWRWDAVSPSPYVYDEAGRMGLRFDGSFVALETCICLAWRKRAPEGSARVVVLRENEAIHFDNVQWADGEYDDVDRECRPNGERWTRAATLARFRMSRLRRRHVRWCCHPLKTLGLKRAAS